MSKLTKAQAKAHSKACEILKQEALSYDDKVFVLENWQESASHVNSTAGAFFTPTGLARDFSIETYAGRIIDLCAGIGALSFAVLQRHQWGGVHVDLTCVEINPDYVAVGRKVVPEATWIEASVFDVIGMNLGRFDLAISNPPFGRIARPEGKGSPRYTGAEFEFHVIDTAAHIANDGTFILPQMSSGFLYSGRQTYKRDTSGKAFDFQQNTGIYLGSSCGIDTALYRNDWRGVSPICEVVCCEFGQEVAADRKQLVSPLEPASPPEKITVQVGQLNLFGEAA